MSATRQFEAAPSPSLRLARSVRATMGLVLLALVPGTALMVGFFGPGVLVQIGWAVLFALVFEATMLALRGAPLRPFLSDLSAPLTAVLFALFMTPGAPWWVAAVGMGAAIVVAKQMYGGLGYSLFNPAMAGVAAVVLVFGDESTRGVEPGGWVALGWLAGGALLLRLKVVSWQAPAGLLGTAALVTLPLWLMAPERHASPLAHLAEGWLVLAAVFIVTDTVSGCTTPRGRLLFGVGVALLTLAIRRWGAFPDGVAFAVLLMNCVAPWLDLNTRPRILGEGRAP